MSIQKVQIVGDLTKKDNKPKGLRRSKKEWEASIAEHIGKFIDKLTVESMLHFLLASGLYAIGYDVGVREKWANPHYAALQNLVMLELARSPLASGVWASFIGAYWTAALTKAAFIYGPSGG